MSVVSESIPPSSRKASLISVYETQTAQETSDGRCSAFPRETASNAGTVYKQSNKQMDFL